VDGNLLYSPGPAVSQPGFLLHPDRAVRRHLAGYEVPRGYAMVEALPRGNAGKIRRGKLHDERGGHDAAVGLCPGLRRSMTRV